MSETKRPELLVVSGKLAGKRFTVPSGGMRLGRSSSNDIRIPDEELSRNHCLFEASGESGIRIIDLASANGTNVNGCAVGSEPIELKPGDLITLGTTTIRVVGEGESAPVDEPSVPVPAAEVDLGLGGGSGGAPSSQPAAQPKPAGARRSPFIHVLWAVALAILGFAAWLLLQEDRSTPAIPGAGAEGGVTSLTAADEIREMSYEKVSADSTGISRYSLELGSDGTLKVTVDDVPDADRHIVKSVTLGAAALAQIREIFTDPEFLQLDRDYAGPTEDPPKLESCEVRIVFSGRTKVVRVVNTPEPDAFRRMRERVEAFSKNELGIWAIQYSAAKLVELAAASARTAQTKWDDRDVEYGNLHAAIAAWREAMFYLETVNPKPDAFEQYRTAKETATAELDRRYSEQRFRADRAINLADWAAAAAELKILCALIPDREDTRYREASAKLVDVEKRQKKGGAQ